MLGAVVDEMGGGAARAGAPGLPSDESLKPVTEAVHSVLAVLTAGTSPAPASS